jgi:cysteine synthase B
MKDSLLRSVGDTPLWSLEGFLPERAKGVRVAAKAEHLNPSGSVKDRAARALVLDGLRRGKLTPGKVIMDATSGNSGIAYAMIGAALGYRVRLCLPANACEERKSILRAYGAELVETDPLLGSDGAVLAVRELVKARPEDCYYPNQYDNPINRQAHYLGTGREIWEQTAGEVTHFVAGMGTSGTFTGVSARLKEFSPAIRVVAVQPDSPLHGLEGMKHMASGLVPGIYDPGLADAAVEVSTEQAWAMTRRLAGEAGIFVGVSSGANVLAAMKVAGQAPAGSLVVTVLCDNGLRYLSDPQWRGGKP